MTARVMDAAQQQHHQKMQMQMAENNDSSSCFNNLTTITTMKEQYQNHHGPNSPSLAKELNASGMEIVRRQHEQRDGSAHAHDINHNNMKIVAALQLHREALSIFEWNKRHALLNDHVELSKEYAIEMACTLCIIGNLLRSMNDFVGAAGTSL